MGPSSFHNPSCQRPGTGCRPRRCLLKGCERRFTPSRPQSRYCGSLCAEAALRWRRVKASRCYRSGCEGRAKRREQNRHYRRRRRERTASVSDGISELDEGKRPACASENFAERMCDRPGCYVLFGVQARAFVAVVFAVWRAAWRYVACWIASRVIGSGGGVGDSSVWAGAFARRTPRESCLWIWSSLHRGLKVPLPQNGGGSGRVGIFFRPSVSFLRWVVVEGTRMDWDNGDVRPVRLDGLGQQYRRYRLADPPGGRSDGRIAAALGSVVAGGRPACGTRSWNCSTASSVWRRHGRWPD